MGVNRAVLVPDELVADASFANAFVADVLLADVLLANAPIAGGRSTHTSFDSHRSSSRPSGENRCGASESAATGPARKAGSAPTGCPGRPA